MSFSKGDVITAELLNSTNEEHTTTLTIPDNGYGNSSRDYYFYCTKTSGEEICQISGHFGWNSSCNIRLYKWENNAWVQKEDRNGTSGWWNWGYDKGNPVSYGEGYYHQEVRLGHHQTFTFVYQPSKTDCTQGSYLKAIISSEIAETDVGIDAVGPTSGVIITAEKLNAGEIYTEQDSADGN